MLRSFPNLGLTVDGYVFPKKPADVFAEGTEHRVDLLLGNNVLAHAPDPNDFVAGLRELLKPTGRIALEFPYAVDFIEKCEFDTIYQEHVFCFSLVALMPLFERHALSVFDVETIPIHGGSLRLFAGHQGRHPVRPSALNMWPRRAR